jgi:hypothetical protein
MQSIKYIKIAPEYLDRNDIRCLNVFRELYSETQGAKKLRGTIALGFTKYDNQNVVWAALPDVRSFIRKLDGKYPYIPYFLMPEPEVKQLAWYLQCLLPNPMYLSGNNNYQMEVDPKDFFWLVYKKIETLIRFSSHVNDDYESVIKSFINGLPSIGSYTANLKEMSSNIKLLREVFKKNFAGKDPIESFQNVTNDEIYFG